LLHLTAAKSLLLFCYYRTSCFL